MVVGLHPYTQQRPFFSCFQASHTFILSFIYLFSVQDIFYFIFLVRPLSLYCLVDAQVKQPAVKINSGYYQDTQRLLLVDGESTFQLVLTAINHKGLIKGFPQRTVQNFGLNKLQSCSLEPILRFIFSHRWRSSDVVESCPTRKFFLHFILFFLFFPPTCTKKIFFSQ